jgi:hypothetical protein
MSYDEFLWSGESVFCKCGHHVEFHKTDYRILSVFGDNVPYTHCRFKQDEECKCKEFTPYRNRKK